MKHFSANQKIFLTSAGVILSGIPAVWAHSGHDGQIALSQHGLSHYLTAPAHAAPLAAIAMLTLSWFWSKGLHRNK